MVMTFYTLHFFHNLFMKDKTRCHGDDGTENSLNIVCSVNIIWLTPVLGKLIALAFQMLNIDLDIICLCVAIYWKLIAILCWKTYWKIDCWTQADGFAELNAE